MSRHAHRTVRTPRPSTTLKLAALWLVAASASQACTFDTADLDALTCSEDGETQGERVCRDGYWVVIEPQGVDMQRPTPDMQLEDLSLPDQDLPLPDMRGGEDMPIVVVEDMPADMTTPPEDMETLLDMSPDMFVERDMPGEEDMSVECPTQPALLCEMFRAERDNKACADLSAQAFTLANGCVIPAGTQCDCLQDNEVCTITDASEGTGICATPMCQPESNAAYCARVQAANTTTRICGKGFTIQDNCGMRRPDVSCDSCAMNEVCEDSSAPSQCVCDALDPVQDRAALCQQYGSPCGDLTVQDGCGGQITLSDCTTCSSTQTCAPVMNPQPGQAAAICEQLPVVQRLPSPPGLSTNARFGAALATHGDWLAVGAPNEAILNSDNDTVRCGAVHMYQLEQGAWVWKQRVADARGGICNGGDEEFGFAVDVMDDRLVIGAPGDGNAGRVHLYSLSNGQWGRRATFGPDQDIDVSNGQYSSSARIGHSVAIQTTSSTTYRVGVGAPLTNFDMSRVNAGAVYAIDATLQNNTWSYTFDLSGSDFIQANANLGTSTIWRDGTYLWSGSPFFSRTSDPNTGAIDEYTYTNNMLSANSSGPFSVGNLGITGQSNTDDAYYGYAMASDAGSSWLAVGAPGKSSDKGLTYMIERTFSAPALVLSPTSPDDDDSFGYAVDTCSTSAVIVGAPGEDGPGNVASDTGAAFVYERTQTGFILLYEARIPATPTGARAGDAVAIHPDWGFFSASYRQSGEVYVINLDVIP